MALMPPVERRDRSQERPPTTTAGERASDLRAPDYLELLDIRDWRRLGRSEQKFFETTLVVLEVLNLTLGELLAGPGRRRADDLSAEMNAHLGGLERDHLGQYHSLQRLHRRLDIDNRDLRNFVAEQLRTVLGKTSPVDTWDNAADATALVVTIDAIVSGALVDTTYAVIGRVLGQHDLLPGLADFFESRQSENRNGLQHSHPLLRRFRAVPSTDSMIETTFDRSVLPCVEFIRSIQRRFDSVGLGFLPDEMVSKVLDGIFDLTARSKPTD